jgi:diguanylate cyclase (GGDEF)-like protein
LKSLFTIIVPVFLLALAFYVEPEVRALPAGQLAGTLALAPLGILGAGMLVALRFNRSRVFFVLATLALAHGYFAAAGARGDPVAAEDGFALLAVLVPLDLAVFSFLKERGILTAWGASRFALLGVEAAALVWLAVDPRPEVARALRFEALPPSAFTWTPIPQPGLLALQLAGLLIFASVIARPSPQSGALAGALASAAAAFQLHGHAPSSAVYVGAAGLMLAFAVLETSYRMAYLDELTALPGRRALSERLLQLGSTYTVAMVDIDHFKKFNDTYGHDVGDDVLRMVAGKLGDVGAGGVPYRYGGEEFAILFAGKRAEDVKEPLEALRARIAEARFVPARNRGASFFRRSSKGVTVTVSIGAASPSGAADPWDIVKAADKALYRAKEGGRNRVVVGG